MARPVFTHPSKEAAATSSCLTSSVFPGHPTVRKPRILIRRQSKTVTTTVCYQTPATGTRPGDEKATASLPVHGGRFSHFLTSVVLTHTEQLHAYERLIIPSIQCLATKLEQVMYFLVLQCVWETSKSSHLKLWGWHVQWVEFDPPECMERWKETTNVHKPSPDHHTPMMVCTNPSRQHDKYRNVNNSNNNNKTGSQV